jgi:hypothetical protein
VGRRGCPAGEGRRQGTAPEVRRAGSARHAPECQESRPPRTARARSRRPVSRRPCPSPPPETRRADHLAGE